MYHPDDFHEIIDNLGSVTDIVYTYIPESDGANPRMQLINCVGIIKHILGIQNRWLWTPRQLYLYLIKYMEIR